MPAERVKILLNGEASNGSVALKPASDDPDGWSKLLAACSKKLNIVVTRLFTADGFGIDELDEIEPGETLYCSAGEDFVTPGGPFDPSRMGSCCSGVTASSSRSSLSSSAAELSSILPPSTKPSDASSQPHPISTTSSATTAHAPSTPSHDTRAAGEPEPAQTPEPVRPSPEAFARTPPADTRTPPPYPPTPPPMAPTPPPPGPHAHLTVLQAAPLTGRGADGKSQPLPLLNLPAERTALLKALRETQRELSVHFAPATTDALRMAITRGTQVLHWSGHGEENYVAFEDGGGGAQEVTPQLLASTCDMALSPLKLVFVCACHSQTAALAFVRAGVKHVVAVHSRALILDQAAICFTRHFYVSLLLGHTVKSAFDTAQRAVTAMPGRLTANMPAEVESRKFVLLPQCPVGSSHHDVALFDRPFGELTDRSTPLCPSNVPALSENFVGRQPLIHRAVQALTGRRRCVCIVGAGGIGKSAIAVAVCGYVRLRHVFPDGTFHVDARGLSNVLMLTYAIATALQLPIVADATATERMVRDELVGHLATKHALLYIDRCDHLTTPELAPLFGELVSAILRRAPSVKLLLTCRKSVGVADETPLTIPMSGLTPSEASILLQNMAPRVPHTHAAALAELCGNMPLALRLCGCALASQRVPIAPEQLISRLEGETRRLHELHKLSSSTGDESVEAVIASSYNSLSPPLQLAFLALCEFPGSFDASAASAILDTAFNRAARPLLNHLRDVKRAQSQGHMHANGSGDAPAAPAAGEAMPTDDDDEGSVELEDVTGLMKALIDDSMIELLPPSASIAAAHAAALAAAPASTLPGAAASAMSRAASEQRYRLHELIRLFGSGQLADAKAAGHAAQAIWRASMVRHWAAWLAEQSDLWRSASAAAIGFFDLERHNIEAVLAMARNACPALFPHLLTSGRLLLRQRLDPGSRMSLILSALEATVGAPAVAPAVALAAAAPAAAPAAAGESSAAEPPAAEPPAAEPLAAVPPAAEPPTSPVDVGDAAAAPPMPTRMPSRDLGFLSLAPVAATPEAVAEAVLGSVEAETAAWLYIELGYVLGEQQRRAEQSVEYVKALMLAAGREAGLAILSEAGVSSLADGVTVGSAMPTTPAPCTPASKGGLLDYAAAAAAGASRGDPTLAFGRLDDEEDGPMADAEREQEEQLRKFFVDSGIKATPGPAQSELSAEALNMLGVSLDMQSQPRPSQILLSHAMMVRRKLLGRRHHEVAATYNNLANLLRKPLSGRSGRGPTSERAGETQKLVEALYRRAIAIRESVLGPQSPQLAASLSNLSVFIVHVNEPLSEDHIDEAETLLRKGLKIRRAVFGDSHPETGHSYHLLGNLLSYQRKQYDKAEGLYQRALEIRCQYYTRQSDRAGQTLFNLAHLLRAKGEEDKAEKLFIECLVIREAVCGQTHTDSIKTAEQLASLYRQQGRQDEARKLHAQIADWRRRQKDGTVSSGAWLRAQVPFPLRHDQMPAGYKLKSKVYGHRNIELKHIEKQSGAERVYLSRMDGERSADTPPPLSEQSSSVSEPPALNETSWSSAISESALNEASCSSTASAPDASAAAPAAEPPPLGASLSLPSLPSNASDSELGSAPAAVLNVTAGSDMALRRAVELCKEHFERIRADVERYRACPRRQHGSGSKLAGASSAAAAAASREQQRFGASGRQSSGSGAISFGDFFTHAKPSKKTRSSGALVPPPSKG